jgi:hypothetical protein
MPTPKQGEAILWNTRFATRQMFCKKTANSAYLAWFAGDASDDASDDAEDDAGDDVTMANSRPEKLTAAQQRSEEANKILEECGCEGGLGLQSPSTPRLAMQATSPAAYDVVSIPTTEQQTTRASKQRRISHGFILDPIEKFIGWRSGSDMPFVEAERLEAFCFGATHEGLLQYDGDPVALVEEGSFESKTYRRRGPAVPEPLDARRLYFHLRKSVGTAIGCKRAVMYVKNN